MRRQLLYVVAALAVLLPTGTTLAQDPTATDSLLANVNAARAANGLPPYSLNPLLTAAAQAHSEDMAAQAALLLSQGQSIAGAIVHSGSDGSDATSRVLATGYPAIQVGENVYATQFGPQAAFDWWMASDAHRHNILHPRYLEIGIGVAPGPEGSVMYTLVFSHSADSPVLPTPAPPPTAIPPTPVPSETPTPTATAVPPTPSPTATPRPTSTTVSIPLPPAESSPTPDLTGETPESGANRFAGGVWPWVILLASGAVAAATYVIVRLRRRPPA